MDGQPMIETESPAAPAFKSLRQRLDEAQAEAARLAEILDLAAPPEEMAAAPVAPARGPMRLVPNWVVSSGGTRLRDGAHWEEACALSQMIERARRRHEARGDGSEFVAPFTPGQVSIAATYRVLTERHAAGGVRCSSLEALRAAQVGSGGEFIDAYIEVGRKLAVLHRRIGPGLAMQLRRIRPSSRGSRVSIANRRLVDMVCLGGMSIDDVLGAHGWNVDGTTRRGARDALAAVLDRMIGYREESS